MNTTTRPGAIKLFGTLGALATALNAGMAKAKPAMVTQRELQELTDLWSRGEVLAANIRRRLEMGADLERGTLGVSTYGSESIAYYGTGEATNVPWAGLNVAETQRIAEGDAMLSREYPDPQALVLC